MADVAGFPRRDARRRIVAVRDFLGLTLAGVVAGAVALAVFDGVFALLRLGDFGGASGWLAIVLPCMVFVEEFRAWAGARGRAVVAFAGAAVGLLAGLAVAGLAGGLGDLAAGALAATALSIVYATLWFYGIRTVAGRTGEDVR